ncbi:MAG: VOC family protein [Gemmatimonadetes bacterium]|nr:VOC family protein [Gemmatimonadota bacterium]
MRPIARLLALAGLVGVSASCAGPEPGPPADRVEASADTASAPDILATNAFYYYRDVEAASAFYQDILGFETVADLGFARIVRVAPTSYLTLVDETRGSHSAEEPKSVTLAIVTEQVEGWWTYLAEQEVPMRAPLGEVEPGRPHDGFVAIDPEGYLLEFERFNPHAENVDLIPLLTEIEPLGPAGGSRPADLTVQGTVLWLYYRDIPAMQRFWERLLGADLLVDQGWAKVYQASRTGFVGLVDGERGLHQATDQKAVTVSFFSSDTEAWSEWTRLQGLEVRDDASGAVEDLGSSWIAYDPEGYSMEWVSFFDAAGNERLFPLLQAEAGR